MTRVKICGITNVKDAQAAVAAGADALGFIFAPSPRRISAAAARRIISRLPPFIGTVGVFVNERAAEVDRIIRFCDLTAVQLHGEESNSYCARFRSYCKIIKSFRIKDKNSFQGIQAYRAVDAFLFDTFDGEAAGGTGRRFPLRLIPRISRHKPIIIAGGVNAENVGQIIRTVGPYAVDVSSGVESRPGIKNKRKIETLLRAVRQTKR